MGLKHIGVAVAALLAAAGSSWARARAQATAAVPDSRRRSIARPATSMSSPPPIIDIFTRAFAAAAEGDWSKALALGNQGHDTAARQLLQWRYALDRNSGAKFADIDAVMKMAAGWPLPGLALCPRRSRHHAATCPPTPDPAMVRRPHARLPHRPTSGWAKRWRRAATSRPRRAT